MWELITDDADPAGITHLTLINIESHHKSMNQLHVRDKRQRGDNGPFLDDFLVGKVPGKSACPLAKQTSRALGESRLPPRPNTLYLTTLVKAKLNQPKHPVG